MIIHIRSRLSDLCDQVSVHTDTGLSEESDYLCLKNLSSGSFTQASVGKKIEAMSATTKYRASDVLYAKLGPALDKAVLAQGNGVCTTELLVLRAKEKVDPRFIVGVLHAPAFVRHAVAGITGTTRPRTSWNHISEFTFPQYNETEQKSIADIFWQMHESIQANEEVIMANMKLQRTAMNFLFTQGTNGDSVQPTQVGPIPNTWKIHTIGELFDIKQGFTISRNLATGSNGIPFLRTKNVKWGSIDISSVDRMDISQKDANARWLKYGDILICEGGDIGRTAIWYSELDRCTFQNHVFRLRPIQGISVIPEFVMYWMQEGFKNREVYKGIGNSTTIPNLSRSRLENCAVPLPPKKQQIEIVKHLDTISRNIKYHQQKVDSLNTILRATLDLVVLDKVKMSQKTRKQQ